MFNYSSTVREGVGKMVTQTKAIFEASLAHDKARQLPIRREERAIETLWDWACNYPDQDVKKVYAELEHHFQEKFAFELEKQLNSGNR